MATLPASRLPQEPQPRTRLLPAAACALVAEALLLGGAFALLTHESHTPAEPPPTLLTLAAPAPAPQPKPPVVQPVPKPAAPVRPVVPVRHVAHVVPPKPVPAPAPRPKPTPAPVLPSAMPTDPPPAPHPSPPPPAAAPAPAAATPSFEGELRAAIQAALRYPEAARMAGMAGHTRVAFKYRDGTVTDVKVVISSGIGLLDRAALAAVRDANYPKPEAAWVGKTLSEQLWVTFNLDDHA